MSSSVFPARNPLTAEASDFLKQSDPAAYAVWRLADGSRSIQVLAEAASIRVQECWDALDRLFDQGALAQRMAPPSSTPHPALLNRREAMSKVMLGAVGATALMSAPQVFADTGISMETNTSDDASTANDSAAELKRPVEQRKKQASEHGSKIREKRHAIDAKNSTESKKAVERHKKQIDRKLEEKKTDKAE